MSIRPGNKFLQVKIYWGYIDSTTGYVLWGRKQTCKEYKAKNVTSAEWSNQIVQNNIVMKVIFYLILLAHKFYILFNSVGP